PFYSYRLVVSLAQLQFLQCVSLYTRHPNIISQFFTNRSFYAILIFIFWCLSQFITPYQSYPELYFRALSINSTCYTRYVLFATTLPKPPTRQPPQNSNHR